MSNEKIQEKLNELEKQQEQIVANLHAVQGARQVLMQLLEEEQKDNEQNIEN